MNVAANEDRIADSRRGNSIDHALASSGKAVPAVRPITPAASTILLAKLRNKLLLRNDVPRYVRMGEAFEQPFLLLRAKICARRIEMLGTAIRGDVSAPVSRQFAGLFAPILTAIENGEVRQIAEPKAIIEAQCIALRHR